jgi:hypothetical protein
MPDPYLLKLAGLGFGLNAAGGTWPESLVREFQGYARNANRFALIENPGDPIERWTPFDPRTTPEDRAAFVYPKAVTGVLDQETKLVIDNWERKRLRCPVVLEAWHTKGIGKLATRVPLGRTLANVWNPTEPDTKPRVYAVDFTDVPPLTDADLADEGTLVSRLPGEGRDRIVVGSAVRWKELRSGPGAVAGRHAFRRFVPRSIDAGEPAQWSDARRSAFRVAYAATFPEIGGFLDTFNAYDSAFLSFGPCQWQAASQELGALLAIFQARAPAHYAEIFTNWGLGFANLQTTSLLQRTAAITVRRSDAAAPTPWHELEGAERIYLSTWHVGYRLQKAARTNGAFRRAMFDLTRVRANDVGSLLLPNGTAVPPGLPGLPANPRVVDVFSSELTLALIVRWHIKYPSDVVGGAAWGPALIAALRVFAKTAPPHWSTWTETQQLALADILTETARARNRPDLVSAFGAVRQCQIPPPLACATPVLRPEHRSALLDTAELPAGFGAAAPAAKGSAERRPEASSRPRVRLLAFIEDDGTSTNVTCDLVRGLYFVDDVPFGPGDHPRRFTTARRFVVFDANGGQQPIASIPLVPGGNTLLSVGPHDDILEIAFVLPAFFGAPSNRHVCQLWFEVDAAELVKVLPTGTTGPKLTKESFAKEISWQLGAEGSLPWFCPGASVYSSAVDSGVHALFVPNDRAAGTPGSATQLPDPQPPLLLLRIDGFVKFPDSALRRIYTNGAVTYAAPLDGVGLEVPASPGATRTMRVRQRQPRDQNAESTGAGTSWIVETILRDSEVLHSWNGIVAGPTALSLARVEAGRSATFVPDLSLEDPSKDPWTWRACAWVIDRRDAASVDAAFEWREPCAVDAVRKKTAAWWPRSVVRDFEEVEGEASVIATLNGLRAEDGKPVTARLSLSRWWHDDAAARGAKPAHWKEDDPTEGNLGLHFHLSPKTDNPRSAASVSMGALTLNIPECAPYAETDRETLVLARFRGQPDPRNPVLDYRLEMDLCVTGFAPHGQDDVPGDEYQAEDGSLRPGALVFNLRDAAPVPLTLLLRVDETVSGDSSQQIALALRAVASFALPAAELFVLDAAPFFVGTVRPAASPVDLSLSNIVATWTNRADVGAGWELRLGSADFQLKLPPQGIGEEMERSSDDPDLTEGRPADFRFTPPTTLSLSSDTVARRLNDPPWNLRRILGYPGQRDPGAALSAIAFEILYGMSGRLNAKSGLRLAEVGSRLGGLPRLASHRLALTSALAETERDRWQRLRPKLESRLAILEPWSVSAPDTIHFDDASGLSFELRPDAQFRDPIRGGANAENTADWKESGLAGGFPWAFESRNLVEALFRNRRSVTAEMSDLRFSALGAWATQRATFDEGRVKVSATFTMGRLHALTVEHVGRLSVYWAPMRHVIVYERTVVASRQFYEQQESFAGVAALRKTAEYLEPVRPEHLFHEGPALDRGPLLGVRFGGHPPRIAVNSRWGMDVGKWGWKIPLWNPGATPKDVYPRPDVRLLLEGAQASAPVEQVFDAPENLYFFTATAPGWGADTGRWPAIEEVDFRRGPPPAAPGHLSDPPASYGKGVEEERAPAMLGSFTHSLRAGTGPVNLTANRSTEVIRAELVNVSTMRSTRDSAARGAGALAPPLGPLLSNALAAARESIGRDRTLEQAFTTIRGATGDALRVLSSALAGIVAPADANFALEHLASYGAAYGEEQRQRVNDVLRSAALDAVTLARTLRPRVAAAADGPVGDEAADALRRAIVANFGDAETPGTFVERMQTLPGTAGEVRGLRRRSSQSIDRAALRAREAADCAAEWMRALTSEDLRRQEVRARVARVGDDLLDATHEIESLAGAPFRPVSGGAFDRVRLEVARQRDPIDTDAARLGWIREPAELRRFVTSTPGLRFGAASDSLPDRIDALAATAKREFEGIPLPTAAPVAASILELRKTLVASIESTATWDNLVKAVEDAASGFFQQRATGLVAADLPVMEEGLRTAASEVFASAVRGAMSSVLDWARAIVADVASVPMFSTSTWEAWRPRLHAGLGAAAFLGELDRLQSRWAEIFSALLSPFRLGNLELETVANSALQLVRAFGQPPLVPNLGFTRPEVGYYFVDELRNVLPHVKLGPIAAHVNDLATDALNGVNIHLPVDRLQDGLVPLALPSFDLSKILPSFGGLSLNGLFDQLKLDALPGASPDPKLPPVDPRIKVTHGADLATRTAWVQADVDAPFEKEIALIDVGPLRVEIGKARFKATCRTEAHGQTSRVQARGELSGTWRIYLKDTHVVSLLETTLRFENDGKIHFDISPEHIELAEVLKFLTDLLGSIQTGDSGFSVALTPTGVTTRLDLLLPAIQGLVFGVSNLSLGFTLGLSLDLAPLRFRLRSAARLGRRDAPFTITIFVLGGAGYFEAWFDYSFALGSGGDSQLTAGFALAMYASASLAIRLGPIGGGLYAYFGIEARFEIGGQTTFTFAIRLILRGEVSILGLASACLTITLEAVYESGGGFVGRGEVHLQIKVCWFLNIDLTFVAEYRFGAPTPSHALGTSPLRALVDEYETAAAAYVGMFG